MSGVFAVDRGVFSHPLFADEPYTEREAWLWLIAQAAWKPRCVRVRNGTVDLERGQLAFATRFMAQKWQWSEARVRRFLARLKKDTMIYTKTDAHATRITICKYDEYQIVAMPTDAHATRTRRKEEDSKDLKEDSLNAREPEPTASEPMWRIEFDYTFWPEYPNRVARTVAMRAFLDARRTATLETIMDGLRRYVREKPPDREWLNPATFLSEERWNDEPAKPVSQQPRQSNSELALASLGRISSQMASATAGGDTDRSGNAGGDGPPGEPRGQIVQWPG